MNSTSDLTTHNQLKEYSVFLAAYATELLSCGATTVRIEQNLHIIARSWHTHAEFCIMPSHIILNLWDEDRQQSYSSIDRVQNGAINFQRITELSHIAEDTKYRHYTLSDVRMAYERVLAKKRMNKWLLTGLVGCANASFCRLFGGDWVAIAIVWFATINGFFLKTRLTEQKWDYRAVTMLSACVAAIISCIGYSTEYTATPDIALATSVLYLVPGIPFGNAVNDLINGHYLCSLSRFTKAIVITFCLSIGLCVALLLTHITI